VLEHLEREEEKKVPQVQVSRNVVVMTAVFKLVGETLPIQNGADEVF
jgi:hypothetical protein